VLLLLYTLELRYRRRQRERQRARVVARWRGVIADAVTGAAAGHGAALVLPRRERAEFLKLWNTTRNMIEGAAAERIIALAQRIGLPELVRRQQPQVVLHAAHRDQTLGHLRDRDSFTRAGRSATTTCSSR
jgi:transposase